MTAPDLRTVKTSLGLLTELSFPCERCADVVQLLVLGGEMVCPACLRGRAVTR